MDGLHHCVSLLFQILLYVGTEKRLFDEIAYKSVHVSLVGMLICITSYGKS